MQVANGISASEQGDMLRLDSMVMMVQLNLRKQLEVTSQLELRRPGPADVIFTCRVGLGAQLGRC